MNYEESKQILALVKKAETILIGCHRRPDQDSVGSATALYQVLQRMKKKVQIICPNKIQEDMSYIPFINKVQVVDFLTFDFSNIDLLVCLDSADWKLVTDKKNALIPKIEIINIDHHGANERYGTLNLIDSKHASAAELLYQVFSDWGIKLDKDIASSLLAGIIGDTGAFRYPETTTSTLRVAQELSKLGADRQKIIEKIYFNRKFNHLKLWGELLTRMKLEKDCGFVWSAVNNQVFRDLGRPYGAKSYAAGAFMGSVKVAKFGMVMVEEEKGKLLISIRSRKDFDIAKLAKALGGGGHPTASGATIEAPFKEAVEKALAMARKYAKKKK